MDTTNFFDLIANEVVGSILSSLDLHSFFQVTTASKQLNAFVKLSNEQWRQQYANRWLLEDRELAIYKGVNWRQTYRDRFESETDLVRRHKKAAAELEAKQNAIDFSTTVDLMEYFDLGRPEDVGWFPLSSDPWAAFLTYIFHGASCYWDDLRCLHRWFYDSEITPQQAKERILSGKFEVLVTLMSVEKDPDTRLRCLDPNYFMIFERYYRWSDEYKEQRKPLYGLVGFLASVLDPDLAYSQALLNAVNLLWEVASGEELSEEMIIALDIVPKLVNIIMKTKCNKTKVACFSILTFATEASHPVFTNIPFLKYLVEMLFEASPQYLNILPKVIRLFFKSDISFIERRYVASRLVMLMRKHVNDNNILSVLLNLSVDICLVSDYCCAELAQPSTVGFIISLINEQTDEANQATSNKAALLLDILSQVDVCARALVESNAVERLLPFMEDSANAHLFKHIYNILYSLCRYVNMNGSAVDIFTTLLEHKDVLLDCGDVATNKGVLQASNCFWRCFVHAVPPSRALSVKLVNRALPLVLNDSTGSGLKRESALLLASIVEADVTAFQGNELQTLFSTLADLLISFNATKDHDKLIALEASQDSSGSDSNVIGTSPLENMIVEQDDSVFTVTPDPDHAPKITACPWPLDALVSIVQIDALKSLAVQNEQLMHKLYDLYDNNSLETKTKFFVALFFSRVVSENGWHSTKALEYVSHFVMNHRYDMNATLVFPHFAPFRHLFNNDNPTPLVLLGSWIIACMATEEPGRRALRKEFEPELVKWLETYSHDRVAYHLAQFNRLMATRKRKREDCAEELSDVTAFAPAVKKLAI